MFNIRHAVFQDLQMALKPHPDYHLGIISDYSPGFIYNSFAEGVTNTAEIQ